MLCMFCFIEVDRIAACFVCRQDCCMFCFIKAGRIATCTS